MNQRYDGNSRNFATRGDAEASPAAALAAAGRLGSGTARRGRRRPPRARSAEGGKAAKAKSVIQIFLWGGMSHNDTWDPSSRRAASTWATSWKRSRPT